MTHNTLATIATGRGGTLGHGYGHAVKAPLLTRENGNKWRNKLLKLPQEKKIWDALVEAGMPLKLYANIDVFMLAALCIELVIYYKAAREISGHAMLGDWHRLVADLGGAYKAVMAVGNKSFEKVLVLSAQCGVSPAARARMAALNTQVDWLDDYSPMEMDGEQLAGEFAKAQAKGVSIASQTTRLVRLIAEGHGADMIEGEASGLARFGHGVRDALLPWI